MLRGRGCVARRSGRERLMRQVIGGTCLILFWASMRSAKHKCQGGDRLKIVSVLAKINEEEEKQGPGYTRMKDITKRHLPWCPKIPRKAGGEWEWVVLWYIRTSPPASPHLPLPSTPLPTTENKAKNNRNDNSSRTMRAAANCPSGVLPPGELPLSHPSHCRHSTRKLFGSTRRGL